MQENETRIMHVYIEGSITILPKSCWQFHSKVVDSPIKFYTIIYRRRPAEAAIKSVADSPTIDIMYTRISKENEFPSRYNFIFR